MKFDNKVRWFLFVCGCSLIITIFGINYFLVKPESKRVLVDLPQLKSEKAKYDSEWLSYREAWGKISGLSQGWKKSNDNDKVNINSVVEEVIPINDAVAKQINEIERIHQEEIFGKLTSDKRIYNEYRLKLYRDVEFQYQEKLKASKKKLEADLAAERKRQALALANFRKNLERKHQLTLINLELQKRMLIFSPTNINDQRNESERIDMEIARIRGVIKKEYDEYSAEIERELELYEKRKTAEYQGKLDELRKERRKMIETELNRFLQEQDDRFQAWKKQRQAEVEQGIKLRRVQ